MRNKIFRVFIGVFFCGAFLAMGLWAGYKVVTELPLAIDSRTWPTIEGRIVHSKLRVRGRESRNRFSLEYTYEVEGVDYANDEFTFMSGVFLRNARENAARYPLGKTVTVHYHPDRRDISVLETDVNWPGFLGIALLSVVFSYVGFFGLKATFS
ncbi:MAG: DUF3592 domain-containing protein [Gammaproteobacteria bacterium]|nr:DUF3592 domain-containing protein [Gammaproteobacteria bacterium]